MIISLDAMDAIICIIVSYILFQLFNKIIFPKLIEWGTKEIEKNPKWITSQIQQYYGFKDIDFILVESRFGAVPRFRMGKNNRLEFLLPTDISFKEVEILAEIALAVKINIKYGVSFTNKSIYWLSVLCYMLEGGDITVLDKK